MRLKHGMAGLALALSGAAIQAQEIPPGPIDAPLFEGFEVLDHALWFVADGWTNGSHQGCVWSAQAIRVVKGHLAFTLAEAEAQTGQFICGEVQSRRSFHYGVFEARMRAAGGAGVVSAFFSYEGPSHGRPHHEIDFEFLGKAADEVQLNYFVDGVGDHEIDAPLGRDGSQDFVEVAFDWQPDSLRWFVDGRLVHEVAPPLPSEPQRVFFSLWSGTAMLNTWLGLFEPGSAPRSMEVDWFAYTPLGAPCVAPASKFCQAQRP